MDIKTYVQSSPFQNSTLLEITFHHDLDKHSLLLLIKMIFFTDMGCSDVCKQYKTTRLFSGSRYANGQKYCKTCELFMKVNSVRCPYYGLQMKNNNRHLQYKIEIKMI